LLYQRNLSERDRLFNNNHSQQRYQPQPQARSSIQTHR
jgi:hypothetical protein